MAFNNLNYEFLSFFFGAHMYTFCVLDVAFFWLFNLSFALLPIKKKKKTKKPLIMSCQSESYENKIQ